MESLLAQFGMHITEEHPVAGGKLTVFSNDIIFYEPTPGATTTTLDELKEQYQLCMKIRNGKTGPFLSDNRYMKSVGSQEKAFIKNNFHHFADRSAIIVSHGISKFLFNTFMYIDPPKIPMKSFGNHETAIRWLIEEQAKNN